MYAHNCDGCQELVTSGVKGSYNRYSPFLTFLRLKVVIITAVFLIYGLMCGLSKASEAATFSVDTGVVAWIGTSGSEWADVVVLGHNHSQGITANIPYTLSTYPASPLRYRITYYLPDDGSTWFIQISMVSGYNHDATGYRNNYYFSTQVTNPGTFVGPSPGTVESIANNARTSADAARTSADTAAVEAQAAKQAADNALIAAALARDRTWYGGIHGGSAQTVADLAGYMRNNQLPTIENKINNILSSIGPQIIKVNGRNGATATVNTTFDVVIQTTGATEFRARVENGSWSNWVPVGSHTTVTGISGTGARTIQVEARNAAGTTAAGQMTVFKL